MNPLPPRLERLLPLLACPACHGELESGRGDVLNCCSCAATYPIRGGVPILLPGGLGGEPHENGSGEDKISRHPYAPRSEELIQACSSGWVLDLGAGGKLERRDHVVQLDVFRYPMTDVVGSADCLPFKDNVFDGVVSQAVFEHLKYPERAAAEIRRVLKPGGLVKIDTAFLQPEHGYPYHYFNATEAGLLHWFRQFDIQWHGVEPYQHPALALYWFLDAYLSSLPSSARALLEKLSIAELMAALDRLSQGAPDLRDQEIHSALLALPSERERMLAAGVSILARNPAKPSQSASQELESINKGFHTPDQSELLRLETRVRMLEEINERQQEDLRALKECLILHRDSTQFLERYLPELDHCQLELDRWLHSLSFHARAIYEQIAYRMGLFQERPHPGASLARSAPRREDLPGTWRHAWSDERRPFVTYMMRPATPIGLIQTVFSLVRQSYSGWQLILLVPPDANPELRRIIFDLQRLEERILCLEEPKDQNESLLNAAMFKVAKGRFLAWLVDGGTLAFHATEILFTFHQARPEYGAILADHDRPMRNLQTFIRCHHAGEPTIRRYEMSHGLTLRLDYHPADTLEAKGVIKDRAGYIEQVLYHLPSRGL